MSAITTLHALFQAAIASAQPQRCLPQFLPDPASVRGRLIVIGAGKASAAMARAVEDHWPGPLSGLVVTRYGYAVPCQRIEIVEAAHPVPDLAGLNAARRLLALVSGLNEDDVVLSLISGGGSALLPLPLAGISLEDKQAINRALLASGATITEMNTLRRHLSAIKGGRLAAACYPARVINLLMSDVPGDHPIDIASGPTVGDPSTCADALAIVRRYGLTLPPQVAHLLEQGATVVPGQANTSPCESIKPTDSRLARVQTHVIAAPQQALVAAAAVAAQAGYTPYILSDALEGEARVVGQVLAGLALQVAQRAGGESQAEYPAFQRPCVLLSGGETTVTLRGQGRGGRNVECLLAFALACQGHPAVHALMGDTDGVDGIEEIAGAVVTPTTLQRAFALGINPRTSLDHNDAHSLFQALGDSVITGPTLTNVNDFRAILIEV